MALLQISEPGVARPPHQSKLAAGIDLGTTHSLVATVRNSIPEVLDDDKGRPLLPSVVHYLPKGHAETGYAAQSAQVTDPKNTIVSVKRMMGRGLRDITHIENLPYDFADQPGMVQIQTVAGTKSPVEISAEILATLRQRAEDALGDDLAGAVITVPAYFDDAQRQATRDAAKLAGIHVLRLLSEPTAAAIAYGLENASEGLYAAYDLGGGTFDISILRLSRGLFEVLATGGDSALGGDDFDHRLFCWIIEQAQLNPLSREDTRTLMGEARKAKEQLSSRARTTLDTTLGSGERVHLEITAETFEQITHHLVCKTTKLTREALRSADIELEEMQGIVLIGGATRMQHVRREVQKLFGKTPLTNIDPEKVVALGAAMQANLLAGNRTTGDDWLLLDVIPLSLGVETMGELVEKIIPHNATIPCTFAQEFTTFRDGQTAMSIHVLQGERELVSDCRSLARFELRGIPPMPAGMPRIRITYQVDADGLLSVSAQEMHSNVEASIIVKPSYGLTDTEITRILEESGQSAEADMQVRMLKEARLEAERIIYATRAALDSDADLLTQEEHQTVETLLSDMESLTGSTHPAIIQTAVQALAKGTEMFAARRMNRQIRQSLAGKSINDII